MADVSLYPPIINNTQSAFNYKQETTKIYFSFPSTLSVSKVQHVQLKILKQTNNKSIFKINKSNSHVGNDGIYYKLMSDCPVETSGSCTGQYYISFNLGETIFSGSNWEAGALYKVQLRFGTSDISWSSTGFSKWKTAQVEDNTFSEWSEVMVMKAIVPPILKFNTGEATKSSNNSIILSDSYYESTTTPLFSAALNNQIEMQQSKESLYQYRFDLYIGNYTIDNIEEDNIDYFLTSGLKTYNSSSNEACTYTFNQELEEDTDYTLLFRATTVNGYQADPAIYHFKVSAAQYDFPDSVRLLVLSGINAVKPDYYNENGCIGLYIVCDSADSTVDLTGSYVIRRKSEKDNYVVFDNLLYFSWYKHTIPSIADFIALSDEGLYQLGDTSYEIKEKLEDGLVYQDFTIESGIKYEYYISEINSNGVQSSPKPFETYDANNNYLNEAAKVQSYFEYSYLYQDGVQLKLNLDEKVSSFKRTVLASKQDTLGSKYPTILRNGYADYAEFSITGTISMAMDDNLTFLTKDDDYGYFYKDELIIPIRKFYGEESDSVVITNDRASAQDGSTGMYDQTNYWQRSSLSQQNYFIESKFREKVLEFLNDGQPKLYKSASEGNLIVSLMNISLTPNDKLQGLICTFTATAYEIADFNISNLNTNGIITIGSYEDVVGQEYQLYQINKIIYNESDSENKFELVYSASNPTASSLLNSCISESDDLQDGYQRSLTDIKKFKFEYYPRINYQSKIGQNNRIIQAYNKSSIQPLLSKVRIGDELEGNLETDYFILEGSTLSSSNLNEIMIYSLGHTNVTKTLYDENAKEKVFTNNKYDGTNYIYTLNYEEDNFLTKVDDYTYKLSNTAELFDAEYIKQLEEENEKYEKYLEYTETDRVYPTLIARINNQDNYHLLYFNKEYDLEKDEIDTLEIMIPPESAFSLLLNCEVLTNVSIEKSTTINNILTRYYYGSIHGFFVDGDSTEGKQFIYNYNRWYDDSGYSSISTDGYLIKFPIKGTWGENVLDRIQDYLNNLTTSQQEDLREAIISAQLESESTSSTNKLGDILDGDYPENIEGYNEIIDAIVNTIKNWFSEKKIAFSEEEQASLKNVLTFGDIAVSFEAPNSYSLYSTTDITDILSYIIKSQIEEDIGDVKFSTDIVNDSQSSLNGCYPELVDEDENPRYYYKIDDFTLLDIEADSGTRLMMASNKQESEIMIGPTERFIYNKDEYSVEPGAQIISDLKFVDSSYASILYKIKVKEYVMGNASSD